jgi:hypothetical protein
MKQRRRATTSSTSIASMLPRSDVLSYDFDSFKVTNWRSFFEQSHFEKPISFEDGQVKAYQNFKQFKNNYACVLVGFIALAILSNLRASALLALGAVAAYAVMRDLKGLSSIIKTKKKVFYATAIGYVFLIIFFTSALQLFCIGLVGGAAFCSFHAITYTQPPFSNDET